MSTERCPFGKVKIGPRKGHCRKSRPSLIVRGVCAKFSSPRLNRNGKPMKKRRCLKRGAVVRRCVAQDSKGGCRLYEYDAKSVGLEGMSRSSGLLGLGDFLGFL